MIAPISPLKVTSAYGTRVHPITGVRSFHNGVDLRATVGTPIYAPFDGVVAMNRTKNGGYQLILTHDNGLRCGFAHLNSYAKGLIPGDRVEEGQLIAFTGNTGSSTGPHLHFTMSLISPDGHKKYFDPTIVEFSARAQDAI